MRGGGRRVRYAAAVGVAVLAGFGMTGSPYYRVGPGPVISVGGSGGGSWSVTTVRVSKSNWFQWGVAELRGERTLRGGDGGGDTGQAMADAMRTSQTDAALVAARLTGVRATPARVHSLGAVQGPSAGLILALSRVDALTAGDLTGARRVAGTGAIAVDGSVTTVGDVTEKVRAAATARTDTFLVPALQRAEATRAARGTRMAVVGVHSVSEAVNWFCAHGGRASVCRRAGTA